MKTIAQLFAIPTLLMTSIIHANDYPVFLEDNGLLIIEIEETPAGEGWEINTAIPGYTGESYYKWTGPNRFGTHLAGEGTMVYHFDISTPGNYEFRWRSYIAEGNNSTEHNDSWVRFPSGINVDGEEPLSGWTKAYQNSADQWSWKTATIDHAPVRLRQYFDTGEHSIEISGRSSGHALDRLALFKYEEINFNTTNFTNAAQSTRVGGTPDETETTSPLIDWMTTSTRIEANECIDGRVSLSALEFYSDSQFSETLQEDVDINDAGAKTYLKFDLSQLPATFSTASLELGVNNNGEGVLQISTGNHDDWSAEAIESTGLPDVSLVVDSFPGAWQEDTITHFTLDAQTLGNDLLTLILGMESASDPLEIQGSGSEAEPRLVLSSADVLFCQEYAQLQISPESETEEEENNEEEIPSTLPASSGEQDTGGSGSLTLLGLLVMGLFNRHQRRKDQEDIAG